MKPSVQKIITKLSENKVELAAKKIDLAIVDDIAKILTTGQESMGILKTVKERQERLDQQTIENVVQVVKKADAAADKLSRSIDKVEKIPTQIANILDKAEKAAKDLGVSPSSIKFYKEADKLYTKIESAIKEANSFRYTDLERFVR
jgi:ArsR family metal-binding transcriptional regulator